MSENHSELTRPKVSVVMITYNHEKYIVQAIESILTQQTNFPFELVIGDDCSTDGTSNKVELYQSLHPQKIRATIRQKNIGMIPNLVEALDSARGEYVALIEGDDFWTDSTKLQVQHDFLDDNPQASLCFHNMLHYHEADGSSFMSYTHNKPTQFVPFERVLAKEYISTCTTMFRRNCLTSQLPDWFFQMKAADWPLFVLLAERGAVGYIDENMATYRVHQSGCWSSLKRTEQLESIIAIYENLNSHFDYRFNRLIKTQLSKTFMELAKEHAQNNRFAEAKNCLTQSLKSDPQGAFAAPLPVLQQLVRVHFPYFYGACKNRFGTV